ncbi:uncharacterized protein LOC115890000 [Sitophilus oryzae]|uniref:Uncharacterized protein LOC115890000 n=1 Tax=Sitophilus oryzae TaxID=7048 RepID=A0A6J2YRN4_SITOR|nr:uncharacterized protein LOC115890000 [Sitophilus oryzae]
MTRKLTENETVKLVQLYKEQECLWNTRNDNYKSREVRMCALKRIQEGMENLELSTDDIKAKIKSIRGTYYLELDKIEKSARSGGNVYVPKVKWFKDLNGFLKSVSVRRKITDDMVEITYMPGSPPSENESARNATVDPLEMPPATFPKKTIISPSSIRSNRSQLAEISSVVQDLKDIRDRSLPIFNETDYDLFCKCVASQLKKLSEEQASIAQEQIQSVLTQCKLADSRHRFKRDIDSKPYKYSFQ